MLEIFVSPFLLGLSAGIYCFTFCVPFVAPVMVSEQRNKKGNWYLILKFIFGRLLGYITFGAVVGYFGARLYSHTVFSILYIALLILSLLLILHALGLLKPKIFPFCQGFKKYNPKLPVLMGFLMGINICPPFLMSLAYVFTLHSAFKGIIYFLMFFLGTSLYFLPIFFLGYLNKLKEFRLVGRVSALIVGLLFFSYSIYQILLII